MKILYGRSVNGQDYLNDCTLHGLRQLNEIEVIDEPCPWYMYKNNFGPGKKDLKSIYGLGFTIFGTLDDIPVDRNDVLTKIKSKYYDIVIFSRVDHLPNYQKEVFNNYPPNKIVVLDGQDWTGIPGGFLGRCLYFKRELVIDDPKIFPISFGFPKEKIQRKMEKTQLLARSIPDFKRKYIFNNEQDYYNDYNASYFGKTFKKAGWDSLRHYEILGSNCVPYFTDIQHCPNRCLTNLPKELFLEVKNLIELKTMEYFLTNEGKEIYHHLQEQILNHFNQNGTTVQVAKKLLDVIKKHQ